MESSVLDSRPRAHLSPRCLIHRLARAFRPVFREMRKHQQFPGEGVIRLTRGCPAQVWRGAAELFDVSFQPRFLLHEFIMRRSRLDDSTEGRSSWLQDADWYAFRTTAHCENAIIPIRSQPCFSCRRRARTDRVRDGQSSEQSSLGREGTNRTMLSKRPVRCGRQPRRSAPAPSGVSQWASKRSQWHRHSRLWWTSDS